MALRTVATAGGDRLLFLSLGAKQLRRPGDIMVLWKRSLTRRSRKADRARRTTGSRTSCCQSHASFTRGQTNASPLNIKGGSRMLECRTSGSVHGVPGNGHPYRNPAASWPSSGFTRACCCIRQRSREDNKYHTIARLMAGLGRLFRRHCSELSVNATTRERSASAMRPGHSNAISLLHQDVHVEGPEHLVLPPPGKVGIFGHLAARERGREAVGVECSDAETKLILGR
jgi:hypothetical protein